MNRMIIIPNLKLPLPTPASRSRGEIVRQDEPEQSAPVFVPLQLPDEYKRNE